MEVISVEAFDRSFLRAALAPFIRGIHAASTTKISTVYENNLSETSTAADASDVDNVDNITTRRLGLCVKLREGLIYYMKFDDARVGLVQQDRDITPSY